LLKLFLLHSPFSDPAHFRVGTDVIGIAATDNALFQLSNSRCPFPSKTNRGWDTVMLRISGTSEGLLVQPSVLELVLRGRACLLCWTQLSFWKLRRTKIGLREEDHIVPVLKSKQAQDY
jgi:hypothetical protein